MNFVSRAFFEEQPGAEEVDDSTTICLADGTTRGRCPIHKDLTVELGPSVTTVEATEMKLRHFDAILGIPWLLKARPRFDWDEHAIVVDDEMVWPIHQVPREKLPDNLAQAESEGALSEEEDNETENEDVIPLKDTTPEQLDVEFIPTERLEQCTQQ